MNDAGINWSDVGNWIEDSEKLDESKYTEDELQQFAQARYAEGVEAGIKIGAARKSSGGGMVISRCRRPRSWRSTATSESSRTEGR